MNLATVSWPAVEQFELEVSQQLLARIGRDARWSEQASVTRRLRALRTAPEAP